MAWSKSDLDSVDAAIVVAAVAGVAEVSVPGVTVRKYTLKELGDLRQLMRGQVATSERWSVGTFSKD